MASADIQGKFLWHELVTADPGAAGAFYGKVLGWTPQAWDKDPAYTVLLTPKGPAGGMMRPGADGHGSGSSGQWVSYVGTPRVEETVASAQRLGGRVLKGASDIPGGGRYAVLADPHGAVFGIYTPPASGSSSSAADVFVWHELATRDHVAALRFYRELFGWEQIAVHEMGAMGPYVLFGRGGQTLGGMYSRSDGAAAHWLAYVRVASASKAADTARAAGGRVINGPLQVPGGSWVAQLTDPHGAAIAVNQPQTAAESAQQPKPAAPQAPRPVAAAPAPARAAAPAPSAAPAPTPQPGTGSPAAAARPGAVTAHPSAPPRPAPAARPAAPASTAAAAKPATTSGTASGTTSGTSSASGGAAPSAAPKAAARKTAARKSAPRGGASRKKKKAARPARKAGAARKRPAKQRAAKRAAKKGSAARSRRATSSRSGKRSAGARKSARGKRARKRSGRR